MLSQVVVNQPYANLGGNEGVGKRGGYYNYTEHFPQLWGVESVRRWLRKKEDTTRAEYLNRFEKFLLWASDRISTRTPDQFLAWARSQSDGTIVQDLIDEYAETQCKSNAHIATALLRSYLGRNGYRELPKIDWDSTMSFTEGYKRGEVQSLLGQLPDPVHKAYVNGAKDSGLRANDLLYIRYRHIKKDIEDPKQKYVYIEFEKERYQRKKAPGRTFFGPNTLDLLRKLFENGTLSRDPDAKLFRFSYRNIVKVIDHAKKTAGIDPKIQPNHGLRKFFENCLDRTGMDVDKKRQLEGHSNGVRNAYTSQDIGELRKLYETAYQFLDLSETALTPQILLDLQKENEEKTKHIEALKAELAEKDANTQKRMAELEDRIVDRMMVQMDRAFKREVESLQQENKKLEEQLQAARTKGRETRQ